MVSRDRDARVLNYVLTGDIRSGTTVVQSSLSNRPGAVCHANLFHPSDTIRRLAHEAYFGQSRDPAKLPEWFVEGTVSPWQYVNHVVLDNPRHGEQAVGFRILYPEVQKWELYDLFETKCREGDFCVVHVLRSPVACFISLKQAERTGVWTRDQSDTSRTLCPLAVNLDAGELVSFCNERMAIRGKLHAACDDSLDVSYRDLFINYQGVMRKVFDFLELPDSEAPAVSSCRRLRNRSVRERVSNWDGLRQSVPTDIRALLDAEDLF